MTQPYHNFNGGWTNLITTWMCNYITLFYVAVIPYPSPYGNVGLVAVPMNLTNPADDFSYA